VKNGVLFHRIGQSKDLGSCLKTSVVTVMMDEINNFHYGSITIWCDLSGLRLKVSLYQLQYIAEMHLRTRAEVAA